MSEADAVRIVRVTVHAGRLTCEVALAPTTPRDTTPAIAARAVRACPSLPHHACVNECGPTFGDIMACTPVPHLLEHLIIDAQTRAEAAAPAASAAPPAHPRTFVGVSEWIDRDAGRARVEVSFADDLVALRAVSEATRLLNCLLAGA